MMFIIFVNYKASLAKIEEYLAAHKDYLDRCYQQKHFIASGPKEPRTGGIILAAAPTREKVEELIQHDPFYQQDLADYEITEWKVNRHIKDVNWC